jgi:predicted dehydrogenase
MIEELGTDGKGRTAFMTWDCVGKRVNPFTGGSDVIDNQVGIIEFANGVRATFHTNCIAGIHERRMLLLGTRGAIRADMVGRKMEYQRIGFGTKLENVPMPRETGGHGGADDILIRDLLATMLEGAPPKASLPEGVASSITCFAMNEAMRKGTVVDCKEYWLRIGSRRVEEAVAVG